MRTEIHNVVVVRFSLRVNAWNHRLFFDEAGRKDWFAFRARLYRETLGAAIHAQTVKPARVFLLMDTGDRALQEACFPDPGFTPIFTERKDAAAQVAREITRAGLVENVAISRIDSDDIVERSYFEKINHKIQSMLGEGREPHLIVNCKGYRSNFVQIQPMYFAVAPFITLFSKVYRGDSVYAYDHSKMNEQPHEKDATAEWLQVIHGTNVANGFKPVTATSLQPYLQGDRGSVALERSPIDPDWFKTWAGFDLPGTGLFDTAPISTSRGHIRKFWRKIRGKL